MIVTSKRESEITRFQNPMGQCEWDLIDFQYARKGESSNEIIGRCDISRITLS